MERLCTTQVSPTWAQVNLASLWAATSCGKDHTSIQSGYILSLSLEHSGEGAIAPCHMYSKALSLGSSCS